jgi:two-component system chemotaxis response regulator CheY
MEMSEPDRPGMARDSAPAEDIHQPRAPAPDREVKKAVAFLPSFAMPFVTGLPEAAPLRILVVDDATVIRLYYRHLLESAGYEVGEAINGMEGLEKVFQTRFDLCIVDINMPLLDGLGFLLALRGEPRTKTLPALVTTTEAGPHDRQAAFDAGANAYLVKPVASDVLAAHVAALLGRWR